MKFNIGPIPVEVRADFLLIVAVLGAGRLERPALMLVWVAVVFASILWHELGHAVAFRRYGHRPRIQLVGMGGLTSGQPGVKTTPGQDLIISLAGPAAGLALGLAVKLAADAAGPPQSLVGRVALFDLLWVNIGWSLINLLPILPLDGGQALRSVLRARLPAAQADTTASVISCVTAAGALAAALVFRTIWGALLAFLFLMQNVSLLRQRRLARELGRIDDHLRAGRTAEAEAEARKVADTTGSRPVRLAALQRVAHIQWHEGRLAELVHTLNAIAGGDAVAAARAGRLPPNLCDLLVRALRASGLVARAREVASGWFESSREPAAALAMARIAASEQDDAGALEWLSQAVDVGLADRRAVEEDEELVPILALPGAAAVRERLATRVAPSA